MLDHQEVALVRAFMRPAVQEQWLARLAQPKTRKKMVHKLYHFHDLDPGFAHRIPARDQDVVTIHRLLRTKGAPETCYALSTDDALDGQTVALRQALETVVGRWGGTLLSCVPGKLGYFEGEEQNERYLLER